MLNKLVSNNLILLIILAAIWGSSFFVIKICLSSFTPTIIASLRLIVASIFLIILYYSYNKHPKLNFDLIMVLTFIGITGNFLPFYLISWSEQFIPSSTAGLLMSVGPLITLLMSHVLTSDDKFTWIKFLSIMIGFLGIFFILDIGNFNFHSENYIKTIAKIFVIIAAFGYMI